MSAAHVYVTYFDQRFLARGLVMLKALRQHDPDADVCVLCLDDMTFSVITALSDAAISAIAHAEILKFEPRLEACASRPRHAFYATHKPILPLFVFATRPDAQRVTHLDTDCFVFSAMAPVFGEAPHAPILLSPHRYACAHESWADLFGHFNAGFISWRRDPIAFASLNLYREQCLARVERILTAHDFMNQGYLTAWPKRFPGVHVLAHRGANLAPWNLDGHVLTIHGPQVAVDGAPLVFFHFSEMLLDPDGYWRVRVLAFGATNLAVALVRIYRPYFDAVDAARAQLNAAGIDPEAVPLPKGWEAYHHLT